MSAMKSMQALESRLDELGFECINRRDIKWDSSFYLRIMDESGRFLTLEAYYSGNKETIRQENSVKYKMQGLEQDIQWAVNNIQYDT